MKIIVFPQKRRVRKGYNDLQARVESRLRISANHSVSPGPYGYNHATGSERNHESIGFYGKLIRDKFFGNTLGERVDTP